MKDERERDRRIGFAWGCLGLLNGGGVRGFSKYVFIFIFLYAGLLSYEFPSL